jgi:hypothetical protein
VEYIYLISAKTPHVLIGIGIGTSNEHISWDARISDASSQIARSVQVNMREQKVMKVSWQRLVMAQDRTAEETDQEQEPNDSPPCPVLPVMC